MRRVISWDEDRLEWAVCRTLWAAFLFILVWSAVR